MSDLAATNCGCGTTPSNGGCGCNIIIWIILLSCLCGNNGGTGFSNIFGGCGGGCGCGDDCGGNNSCMWLILLLLFCGGGCGCGC